MAQIFEFIKNHYKLLLSWRFIAISILLLLAFGWFVITQVSFFDFVGLKLESLPLYIYIAWFILVLFSFLFAFCMSPYEIYVYRKTKNALGDMKLFEAKKLLFSKSWLSKNIFYCPTAKIKIGKLKALLYSSQFETVKAYNLLQKILKMPLLPYERVEIEIELMKLLYNYGNIKAAKNKLNELQNKKLSLEHQVICTIKQAELYLLDAEYQNSKDILEEKLLNQEISLNDKIALLHSLGVVETHLKNFDAAITLYRQAWNEIKKSKNILGQAERTIENLAFTYTKLGKKLEAHSFIDELEKLIDKNDVNHIIIFSNIKLNIARQTGDRQALLDNYKDTEKNILPIISGEIQFFYIVSTLRMHWNDGIDFEKALKDTKKVLFQRPTMTPNKTLNILSNVAGILKQVIGNITKREDLVVFLYWIIVEIEKLEPEIDKLIDDVPAVLPMPKRVLISFKIEIMKNKIAYSPIDMTLFEELFSLQKEQCSLWQGMQNPMEYLHELMIIIDDYIAYKEQFQLGNTDETKSGFINEFKSKFLPLVISSLNEAEKILEGKENNLAFTPKLIGFAYACFKLNMKKDLAKKYIYTFDESRQSIEHYAIWLREQYKQVKKWLA
ncbi:hypothetical protein AAX30_01819 [Arcobacter porcinus]|nr:hypothetical protein AAX30_01819 [Arcobacter porcinus]